MDVFSEEMKSFLDEKSGQYNGPAFVESDPVQVPHLFTTEKDIEIAAFLTSAISWGRREIIVRNALRLTALMDHSPADFLSYSSEKEWDRFEGFVHRTFQPADTLYFMRALQRLLHEYGGIREVFREGFQKYGRTDRAIAFFRKEFLRISPPGRTAKHFPDIERGSAAKRINLFLRWMVRKDGRGVDFGLWEEIPSSVLYIPLDVHTAAVARKLGLLSRKQNDWKAVEELTSALQTFCPEDPVKYDYALFGLGMYENF